MTAKRVDIYSFLLPIPGAHADDTVVGQGPTPLGPGAGQTHRWCWVLVFSTELRKRIVCLSVISVTSWRSQRALGTLSAFSQHSFSNLCLRSLSYLEIKAQHKTFAHSYLIFGR